ncbi:MAG: voltage-gated potassium channel [Candidatus Lambdaproteobacteria bacterium RIFOXYD2_FULL_50_16]|uniref:Voltage-gated potassium channel n=1 Tax=Candidatus Lambdaproteobacteria bacterium RIFOXYD2_FULL_50_16 TaxID=1817772 RepID=A0A1F6GAG4_9PROT|nr:MAG: voltage-gated potassium channel [Candidatus Lambdaproteobacteria bacterium RIFOXYD2_FULL_50_16]
MGVKERVREIIEPGKGGASKVFDLFIQGLVLFSIVSFSVETLPGLEPETHHFLELSEKIGVTIFSIEYCLRIWTAENKRRFIFSFFGIIDLMAILPFYLSMGIDLRSVRGFRLLRLFRMFKLFRYNRAMNLYLYAFRQIKAELVLFVAVTMFLLYLAAVGIYYFENDAQPQVFASVFHSLWWAVATLFTVGYGDVYPITLGGKIFTFVILMLGVGVVAVPVGLLATSLTQASKLSSQELEAAKSFKEPPTL